MRGTFFEQITLPLPVQRKNAPLHYAYRPSLISGQSMAQAPISVVLQGTRIAFLVTERLLEPIFDKEGQVEKWEVFPGCYCFLDLPLQTFRQEELNLAISRLMIQNKFSCLQLALSTREQLVRTIPKAGYSRLIEKELGCDDVPPQYPAFAKRQVFLDFLFDFFHKDSFRTHPEYYEIRAVLNANPLIAAIISKFDSFYWLDALANTPEDNSTEEYGFHLQRFKQAYRKWENLLLEDTHKVIDSKQKWFKNPEDEFFDLRSEVKKRNLSRIIRHSKDEWSARSKRSKWHFKRLDYCNGFAALFPTYLLGRIMVFLLLLLLLISLLSLLLGKDEETSQLGLYFFLGFIGVIGFMIAILVFRKRSNRTVIDTTTIIEITKLPLIIGSSAVWLFIYTSDQFWSLDLCFWSYSLFPVFIGLLIALLFLKNQIDGFLVGQARSSRESILRASFGIIVALLFSGLTGLVLSSRFTEKALQNKDFLTDYFEGLTRADALEERIQTDSLEEAGIILLELLQNADSPASIVSLDTVILQPESANPATVVLQQTGPSNRITDEELYDELLPHLWVPGRKRQKVLSVISFSNGGENRLRFLPQMILFYSFIAASIGVLVELGYKRFK